ncbi:hypothetical protein EDC02_5923 [Micromonospora sp. Llam0]|uniref:hypothetical protein n=1 Tax=Micromonospora sp. Llam0 TaxID=2485143 RepID=UPI000F479350|nr:hypothetical protein [Micromonospora sp. Llam0]ROO51059.1 hypothetical protein EDC02_5923 [Micromonospora sp. Llam0]
MLPITPHLHHGPISEPRCGRPPVGDRFAPCPGRPHPVTLPIRADMAMVAADRWTPEWYDARTSLWDAIAGRNLHYGHQPAEIHPTTGQLLEAGDPLMQPPAPTGAA